MYRLYFQLQLKKQWDEVYKKNKRNHTLWKKIHCIVLVTKNGNDIQSNALLTSIHQYKTLHYQVSLLHLSSLFSGPIKQTVR